MTYDVVSAVPDNVHEIFHCAKNFAVQSRLDPDVEIAKAIIKGLENEYNLSHPFQYLFTTKVRGQKVGKTIRIKHTPLLLKAIRQAQTAYVIPLRLVYITALSRCCLTQDGNILVRTMIEQNRNGTPLPIPPALDGDQTHFAI